MNPRTQTMPRLRDRPGLWGVAALACALLPLACDQTSDPESNRERLALITKANPENRFQFGELVPEDGRLVDRSVLPPTVARAFLDQRGGIVQLGLSAKVNERGRKNLAVIASPSDLPRLLLQSIPDQMISRGAFSPDGKSLVVSDWGDDRVSLCNGKTTHTVRLDGWTAYPFAFAWSPDNSRVAFYYAPDGENDTWILRNGLVILNTDGKLTVVLKQEDATGTRRLWAKYVPPAWDPSGRYLYYINGVPADKNPPAAGEYVDGVYCPSAVYRFDCQAGTSEFVTDGALTGFLVKENSLLLWPVPKQGADGKWTTFAATFSLTEKKLTPLSDKIRFPRLSPTGRLVACKGGGKVKYYRTQDWSEFGKAIDYDTDPEFWYTELHWIAPESPAAESSSSPSSTTAPAGT